MLTAPDDLNQDELTACLRREWLISAAAMRYLPVGWGSHHWDVTGADGERWFVTVDELEYKRVADADPLDAGFARLTAALRAATGLKRAGRDFVVAPIPARSGEPVARFGERFAVAVYPFVTGTSFGWGEWDSAAHRRGVIDMLAAVHTAPAIAAGHAMADDFAVPLRGDLEAAANGNVTETGPYARPVAALVREHSAAIRRLLDRYDGLVATARAQPGRAVLTHGEPHPGNTMRSADGRWLLIDWDTALIAPPERDLWGLDPGDGSVLKAYSAATGVTPSAELLDLYRLRWDIADIAVDTRRFRRPHTGNADDEKSWDLLRALVARTCQLRPLARQSSVTR